MFPQFHFVATLALLANAVTVAHASRDQTVQDDRPNIVLILSDDHSFPNLGCYGDTNANTPNFDRFAAEGIRFDRAYTMAPQCVPSRASILTGRSPIAVDMTRFSAPLDRKFRTFPELLRDHGYFTGAIGRYFHLDGPKVPRGISKQVFEEHQLPSGAERFDFLQVNGSPRPKMREIMSDFFEKRGDKPYFLWANFHEPHRIWKPESRPAPEHLQLPPDVPDLPLIREDLANLYGILSQLDDKFGDTIAFLDEQADRENTIVIFMGDNGCALLRGKGTLYDRGCHVPMIIRWPNQIKKGRSTSHLISGNDIAPTLLAAADIKVPSNMSGRSFLPLLVGRGDYTPRTAVFAERGVHAYGLPTNTIYFDLSRSVTTKTHRLIYNALWDRRFAPVDIEDYQRPFWADLVKRHTAGSLPEPFDTLYFRRQRPIFELFDLQSDPYELTNLAGNPKYELIEQDLKNQLAEWMILERDFLPLPTEP